MVTSADAFCLFTVTASTGPVEIASGFKNAYGHVVGLDGDRLLVTDSEAGQLLSLTPSDN